MLSGVRGLGLDFADNVHAFGDPAEGGEALAVGVTLAPEIEGGLVADADEEVGFGGVGVLAAGHGEGAVFVEKAGDGGAFEGDEREGRGLFASPTLDDVDLDGVVGLVVRFDGAMEKAAVVLTGVDVAEEAGDGFGCVLSVDLGFDVAEGGFDDDRDETGLGVAQGCA